MRREGRLILEEPFGITKTHVAVRVRLLPRGFRAALGEHFVDGGGGVVLAPLHLGPQCVGRVVIGLCDRCVDEVGRRTVAQRGNSDGNLDGGPRWALAGRTGGERTLRIRERDAHLRTVVFFNEVGHEVVETPFNPRAA